MWDDGGIILAVKISNFQLFFLKKRIPTPQEPKSTPTTFVCVLFLFPIKPHMLHIYLKVGKYLFIIKKIQTVLLLQNYT